jgi:hypothetical protein
MRVKRAASSYFSAKAQKTSRARQNLGIGFENPSVSNLFWLDSPFNPRCKWQSFECGKARGRREGQGEDGGGGEEGREEACCIIF